MSQRDSVPASNPGAAAQGNPDTAVMSRFLSFLSHDLRGGLNGAVLMVEVLRRQFQNDAKYAGVVEDLDVVRRSILDSVATMDRFLSAEKLRLGRLTVSIAPVDATVLVQDIQKCLAPQVADDQVELSVNIPPGL